MGCQKSVPVKQTDFINSFLFLDCLMSHFVSDYLKSYSKALRLACSASAAASAPAFFFQCVEKEARADQESLTQSASTRVVSPLHYLLLVTEGSLVLLDKVS